ncbi:MobQ family relaxase [Thalassobacillus sp. B23F22_16]|uniref:MobQ family relaxase n=1 Tax=Thalassobacillus sp. B23F22_16 TaxID=3459513 RepID=UPI00373EA871
MARGYYMFDCKTVNASTQSAVAMAAYRSGDKLYSLKDGETKKYKERFVQPETFIMKPDHAPEWTLERERLWNEVEKYENRNNARIARSIVLSLPNDMTEEQQTELTREYVKENFSDEGMVADVAIHRDDVNNPHAHVLLTVREFNEHGEWEKRKSKRVPKLDENGNQVYNEKGWKQTVSVKLNDWDKRETLNRWRENWAEKLNEKSLQFGLDKTYSHKSFEEQGRLEKAQIRLTRNEYQYEQRVKQEAEQEGKEYNPVTYYGQKNAEIKKYNEQFADVIHLEDYKTKRDYKSELNQLRKHMHVDERNVEATNLLVDRIKGYVDYKSSSKLYHDFTSNQNKWKLKIERSSVMNNVHEKLLNNIKEQHKKNPDFVKKFGYSIDNFESEMNKDMEKVKESQAKINEEFKKFNELKQASITSFGYQKHLTDTEFAAVYDKANINDFSYDEKYFALQMLKDYNILLPEDKIKKEMKNQDKYNENQLYTPTWKQAKDLMTSINIYDRTINKLSKQNTDKATPEEMKDTIIKIQSYKELKENYNQYLSELKPVIDMNVKETFDNEALQNTSMEVKLAALESYSKLNEDEKNNLNTHEFIENLQQEQEQQANYLNQQGEQQDSQERKEVYKDNADKAKDIASGLFDVLKAIGQERDSMDDRRKKDRTKVFRKRGTDGREL